METGEREEVIPLFLSDSMERQTPKWDSVDYICKDFLKGMLLCRKGRERASKEWDCPQTEVLGVREEDRVQSWVGAFGPLCSLRNVVKTLQEPRSPRKGSALLSPTPSGTGRVQPRRGLGVDYGVQQLDPWSIPLLLMEVCEVSSCGRHSHPSRTDGADQL